MSLCVSITFKVFVHSLLFVKVPVKRKEYVKSAINELTNPFPDSNGNKKGLKGTQIVTYRLRVGDYRVFYQTDEEENKVYVFDIFKFMSWVIM
jgi:mRNA-degrading endonuclease RelE of RelBE toxin-antitoxin system